MSLTSSQRGSRGRDADQLGVLAGLVVHVQHADRPGLDPHARVHRVLEQHEGVERVAVAAERVGDEAVVGRIGGGGEQPPVEEHPAVVVVDLVLVAAARAGSRSPRRCSRGAGALAIAAGHTATHRSQTTAAVASPRMEFRRITNLPPYVFTIINNLKIEARRAGAT